MSLLRKSEYDMKLLTSQLQPSPTRYIDFPGSARNPGISPDIGRRRQCRLSFFVEGISLFTSFWMKMLKRTVQGISGGMTVEASILLPLFLFFFLNMGCAIEIIRFHCNMQLALWKTGSEISLYGYVLDNEEVSWVKQEDGWWQGMADIAFSSTYVKWRLTDCLGEKYIEQSPVTEGSLRLWESELFGQEDNIDIIVTYSVSPWSRLIGFSPFRLANRFYAHIWNGYQIPGVGSEEEKRVYVTESGQVFHVNPECTYIRIVVHKIYSGELDGARNQYGRPYGPCGKCALGKRPIEVYITAAGDCFHYTGNCSGLRRTVRSISMKEAENYRPCSRCVKADE